jgi:hypothetical protein
MTLVVEVAPVEAGVDEIEEIAAHDLSTIGLDVADGDRCPSAIIATCFGVAPA